MFICGSYCKIETGVPLFGPPWVMLCLVARDLLAAGRVQFKNCVLSISEPPRQTQSSNDITSDAQAEAEPEVFDTIQVSHVTS